MEFPTGAELFGWSVIIVFWGIVFLLYLFLLLISWIEIEKFISALKKNNGTLLQVVIVTFGVMTGIIVNLILFLAIVVTNHYSGRYGYYFDEFYSKLNLILISTLIGFSLLTPFFKKSFNQLYSFFTTYYLSFFFLIPLPRILSSFEMPVNMSFFIFEKINNVIPLTIEFNEHPLSNMHVDHILNYSLGVQSFLEFIFSCFLNLIAFIFFYALTEKRRGKVVKVDLNELL